MMQLIIIKKKSLIWYFTWVVNYTNQGSNERKIKFQYNAYLMFTQTATSIQKSCNILRTVFIFMRFYNNLTISLKILIFFSETLISHSLLLNKSKIGVWKQRWRFPNLLLKLRRTQDEIRDLTHFNKRMKYSMEIMVALDICYFLGLFLGYSRNFNELFWVLFIS